MSPALVVCVVANIVFAFLIAAIPTPTSIACISKTQSIETSSLHLGLLGDMQRLNSLFCSVAYSVLEQPDEDEGRDEY